MHHFCLSKNVRNSTAQSLVGRGSLMLPLADRHFFNAHSLVFVNDSYGSFFEKVHVMVDPTFRTLR
jgi:hypothetical protein